VKILFEWYVGSVVNYGKVYASLSVIPVFLLWLYVSWLIALLGFEISFFLQHPEASRGSTAPTATQWAVSIPEAMRAFFAVAEAFVRGGGPVTATQVAQRASLPEGTAFAGLAKLERQGYVARVTAPGDAYLPRHIPSAVKVVELWRALGGRMGSADGDQLDRLLTGAAAATERAFGSTTIQDLLDAGPAFRAREVPGPAQ
jgi:membrane protein